MRRIFPPVLVECIRSGTEPNWWQIEAVAQHIWRDICGNASVPEEQGKTERCWSDALMLARAALKGAARPSRARFSAPRLALMIDDPAAFDCAEPAR